MEANCRLIKALIAFAMVLGGSVPGCGHWAGPLPLGTTNDDRATAVEHSHKWADPMDRPGLPNLHKVTAGLYRGAQPTAEGFRELEEMGVRTVVNLRDDRDDRREMQGCDLAYDRIPMSAWYVEDEDVVAFLRLAADASNAPLFVHCRRGADRTGLAVAVYRIAIQGWTKDEAIAEMTQGGFAFYSGWQNLVRYLHDLDVEALNRRAGIE
jgi:protein tyrosine phosphatase (PTP) superfamily phosphohydrolase (DUF442 family)